MSRNRKRRPVRVLFWILVVVTLGIFAFGGCGRNDSTDAGQDASANAGQHQPGHQGGAGRAAGGPSGPGGHRGPAQQAIPVAVSSVTSGSISSYYRATATLEAEKNAQVLARANGVIQTLVAEEGDLVQTGAPLLHIKNDEYRFRVEQAAAATANLRARFERLEQMMKEGLATEEEFQAARSDLASAEADEGLARLNFSYTTVAAPFSGRVTERLVNVGQNVSNGDPLFVMADFDPLLARVHVPSREFNRLQKDQAVDLVLDSNGTRLTGHIKLISPIIDPTSGTIKITVEVSEYPEGTRPGEFAQVQIVTEKRDGAVLVPRGAVLTDKGESVVYVPVNNEEQLTAERRLVEVGFTDDEHVQILSGLVPGDTVVTKGQRSLKHGAPVKVLEGESDSSSESDAADKTAQKTAQKTARKPNHGRPQH